MTRFRTMYDLNELEEFVVFTWDTSSGQHISTIGTKPLFRKRWMYDVVTPKWRKLMSQGKIVNNPMTSCDHTITQVPAHIHRHGTYNGTVSVDANWRFLHGMPPGYPWTTLDINSLAEILEAYEVQRNMAITSSWSEVQVSEIQALASLGEMPETVTWIVSLLKRALSVIRAVKAKSLMKYLGKGFSSGKQSVDTVSDAWLELRYALRPLVFEMQQAVTALQTQVKKGSRQTARGYHRDETAETTYGSVDYGPVHIDTRTTTVRRSNFRAGVLYTIDEDINGIMAVWGIDQPLETIWELTPFSFIIDWFFNVGDIISSWSFNAGLHPLASFVTEHHEFICEVKPLAINFLPADPLYNWTIEEVIEYGSSKQVVTVKRRIPNPARAFLPTCNIKLDVAKITDLAFIGRSLLNGFGKKQNLRV